MKYRYISDCHIHSEASFDGHDSVDIICQYAVKLGLHAIAITDHFECNEYRNASDLDCVRKSISDTRRAAIKYADRITIYRGIELGQATQNQSIAEEILSDYDFDFILGSLHNLRDMQDFYFLDYRTLDIQRLFEAYFDQMLEMIELGYFDSLAHMTYPLRYLTDETQHETAYRILEQRVDAILRALIRKGKAMEVNTSGLRQNLGSTMPGKMVIKRFHELGGKHVTIGSDAHRWADIGSGIEETLTNIKNAGFDDFTVFVNRHPHLLPIA